MKPNQYKATHVSLRIGLFLIALLVGFIFPLSFAVAALLGVELFADLFGTPGEGGKQDRLAHLTADDDWRDAFLAVCESPAEAAFLNAMISDFALAPRKGVLVGPTLKLALQVEVDGYRLDFLVDDRLVVEIDGAAYHSSPEARKRDAARDRHFSSQGYQILRIPAKYPLYIPQEATDRVRDAQATLKARNQTKAAELRDSLRPARVVTALSDGLDSFAKEITRMSTEISRQAEEQKERDRLRVERETAEAIRQIEEELAADPELKEIFDNLDKEFR